MQVVYTEADLYCKKCTAKQAAGGKGEAPKEDEATLLDLLQVRAHDLRLPPSATECHCVPRSASECI